MEWSHRRIAAKQIDKQLKSPRDVKIPPAGREVLGMNMRQLAERTDVSNERIIGSIPTKVPKPPQEFRH